MMETQLRLNFNERKWVSPDGSYDKNAAERNYKKNHRDIIKAQKKRYREKYPDKHYASCKRWREEHPREYKVAMKRWTATRKWQRMMLKPLEGP